MGPSKGHLLVGGNSVCLYHFAVCLICFAELNYEYAFSPLSFQLCRRDAADLPVVNVGIWVSMCACSVCMYASLWVYMVQFS